MALAKTSRPMHGTDPLNCENIPAGAVQMHMLTLRLKRLLDADINQILTKYSNLSLIQWRMLAVLHGGSGSMSQRKLVREIVSAQGQASRALYALQTEGMVLASQSEKDRRSWNYSLTEQGRGQFAALLPHMEERREALESAISREELVQFEKIASKIAQVAQDRLKKV